MTLPTSLQAAIEAELLGNNQSALALAVENLSHRYRNQSDDISGSMPQQKKPKRQYMIADIDRRAYIACRMPATYAVIARVMDEMIMLDPGFAPMSLVDLGSGPGTALWAACRSFESLKKLYALEGDANLIELGKRLTAHSDDSRLSSSQWIHQDLAQMSQCLSADMIIASYALGELEEGAQMQLLGQAWKATGRALVLIEPGTPQGFSRILRWRTWLIAAHATLLAPCPHAESCPMAGGDWCHFSERLARTSYHRQLKSGTLGHEDEKFSYLVAVKKAPVPVEESKNEENSRGRILRHPQKHTGFLELTLCTAAGLLKKKISRREGDLYKKARKLEWGDLL